MRTTEVSKPRNLPDFISAVASNSDFWFGLAYLPHEEQQ
jgi:hypothetical protein